MKTSRFTENIKMLHLEMMEKKKNFFITIS